MNDTMYKNYRAEQDLINCGLTADSIAAIRSTQVVTHNESQHVMHNSQAHTFSDEHVSNNTENYSDSSANVTHLQNELQIVKQQFSRYKNYADNRIATLEREMTNVLKQLKNVVEVVTTLKSNSQAAANRAKLAQGNDKEASEAPVDRNNVAPADVAIEKMFYFGYK